MAWYDDLYSSVAKVFDEGKKTVETNVKSDATLDLSNNDKPTSTEAIRSDRPGGGARLNQDSSFFDNSFFTNLSNFAYKTVGSFVDSKVAEEIEKKQSKIAYKPIPKQAPRYISGPAPVNGSNNQEPINNDSIIKNVDDKVVYAVGGVTILLLAIVALR